MDALRIDGVIRCPRCKVELVQTSSFDVTLHPDRLDVPLRRKKPTTFFVASMGDLFHENVGMETVRRIFWTMEQAQRHTFQVLTKRPRRMLELLTSPFMNFDLALPLPNVHLGVTAENQATADERIPLLLQTPAAVRFVSCEPLLGPIDLRNIVIQRSGDGNHDMLDALNGMAWFKLTCIDDPHLAQAGDGLSWVIVGGETGPGARPMHPDWARDIRDQCQAAGVPFFFKSWGAWLPLVSADEASHHPTAQLHECRDGTMAARVGKKRAGHLLDGREWREFPQ